MFRFVNAHIIPTNILRNFYLNSTLRKYHLNKNVDKQVKMLRKLLGDRHTGSKRQWYPNEVSSKPALSSTQSFSKSLRKGKNVVRRVHVLNKLFMKYVTDLMTTGEISQEIIGKGLEISKVNIASDFNCINVYWIAKGDANDEIIDATLQQCSGRIRHELSQLRLMGQVPKIYFLKDKIYSNLAEVQVLLKTCDFGADYVQQDPCIEICSELHLEKIYVSPVMKYVMSLDHKEMMTKILTKMKKSKQAWEIYDHAE